MLQRALRGKVTVSGEVVGEIGPGVVVLLGCGKADTSAQADLLAAKIAQLRFFEDDQGLMNRSLLETGGAALVVSQFTLYGDCRKGRRPSFTEALGPEAAEALYERFVAQLRLAGARVETGRFRAHMEVELVNDGPVTLLMDTE